MCLDFGPKKVRIIRRRTSDNVTYESNDLRARFFDLWRQTFKEGLPFPGGVNLIKLEIKLLNVIDMLLLASSLVKVTSRDLTSVCD